MSLNARERDVMRRLVEWAGRFKIVSVWPESRELQAIIYDVESLLSESSEGPVVSMHVHFYESKPGDWSVYQGSDEPSFVVRIPVPAHLVNPPAIEGEVVP